MLIQARPTTDPELATLIAAQQPEPEDVQYLVGVVDGRAIACGGLRALDAQTGEITRVYVRPAFRGRGIARQLLAALEEMALGAGHTVLRMEMGADQSAAVALSRSAGYVERPDGPGRVRYEKHILVAA
ncbi:GNAT family N-acetyltransferase [Phytohabitans rumicis]|uniref:N-acetyltransferase domain-containing protein n=1 Tax=Phytohabitans rumicis TaxID=1076125 RepID=A0A6V8LD50_9ACTN|nr:GNAT family N-acetyltransferase [Phytohabitans rumicis]GFJ92016.1 hypothetical protein Prum_056580 [Phytohabitans rumicis]